MENKKDLTNIEKFTFFDWFLMVASLIVALTMVSPFVFVLRSYPVPATNLVFSAILVMVSVWEFYQEIQKVSIKQRAFCHDHNKKKIKHR